MTHMGAAMSTSRQQARKLGLLELGMFELVVSIQGPAIAKAKTPRPSRPQRPGAAVPLIFHRIYLSNSFKRSVGFHLGMRLFGTAEMLLDLVVLGPVIRLLTSATRRGRRAARSASRPWRQRAGRRLSSGTVGLGLSARVMSAAALVPSDPQPEARS
jgi:hypothetical protein